MAKRDLDELRIGDGSETSHNRGLSEPSPPLPPTARSSARWRTILARATAPVLASFALAVVLFGSNRDTDYELQLISADAAQPGADLPLRALLYEKLRSIEGPRLAARVLDVQLEDRSGVARARGKLRPSRGSLGDIEGSLHIPAALHGEYRLRASVQVDTIRVDVEKPLAVGKAARLPVSGRPLRALQQFSEGPLQAEPGELPADALRVRVGGGACVPEEECLIYVYVGSPSVRVWIEGNSTVTPQPAAPRAPDPRAAQPLANIEPDSLVRTLSIVTHGPEAQLWLRASRMIDGAQVARRSVRLPIALGASALRLKTPVVLEGHPLSFQLLGGDGGCIIDVFRDGEWIRTASARSCTQPQPIAALPPGVYRIQGRRDPFSSATAGVAIAQVVDRHEPSFELDTNLANRVLTVEPDPLAQAKISLVEGTDQRRSAPRENDPLPYASFGWFAAILESGIIELPRAASGYASMLERLSQTQAQLRSLSILALVLGAISLALAVGRSGLRAVAQADAILRDAGHSGPVRRRARARSMLSLALSVLSLMLVFVVLGAYVVARGGP